ncbi:MAG: ParA family protein, partial [Sulfurimicrobium sp.]|nr:ParA family protein [Sulfurimicrobium sp.]
IDLDPQAHLTIIGDVPVASGADSVFGFYAQARPLSDLVRKFPPGGNIIPSHMELSKVDALHGKGLKSVMRLKAAIQEEMLEQEGTPIVIDCCPMLNVLSLNAIFASGRVLVPISADFLSVKGALQLEGTLKALEHVVKKRIERRYVVTRYDSRRRMSREILVQLRERFGDELCSVHISENVSLAESPAYNKDIFTHAPHSQGAKDYDALLTELAATGFL